jgi:hypothetical protein
MPFFGFLGGIVLASLVIIVVANRSSTPPGRRLNLTTLPPAAFLLFAAYVVLFAIMWMYFFASVLGQVLEDYPGAHASVIFRSFLTQMERWDFIVTLLAFIAGGLLVLATDRAAGSGGKFGPNPATPTPIPPPASEKLPPEAEGVVAASLRQLKRITALNLLLVFALILVTMPALLPWVERRLDVVKLGSFEARLAPLAENTRKTSTPDTPALATANDLKNYLRVTDSIDRAIRVLEAAPEVAGDSREKTSVADLRRNYELTRFFFAEEIVPRVARLLCMSKIAGVGISDVPGTKESASALLSALRDGKTRGAPNDLRRAVATLSAIDSYYDDNFSHIGFECYNRIYDESEDASLAARVSNAVFGKDQGQTGSSEWSDCLNDWQSRYCRDVIKNGYTIRFILEFVKLSSREQGSVALFRLLQDGMLDDDSYAQFNPTDIDNFNIQYLKTVYLADANVMPNEIIEEYLYLKSISERLLGSLTEECDYCDGGRRPKASIKAEYEVYRTLAEWYVDAEAIITVGTAMLRRMPLNRLHDSDATALKKLLSSAIRSRDDIQDTEGFRSQSDNEAWAAAMLDEGIATVRYVQLAEAPESLRDEHRPLCNAAKDRLRSAVDQYKILQKDVPEHRINRMRAERTLVLVEQHCG